MIVEVHLYATLRKFGPGREGPFPVELGEEASVSNVLEHLGIPSDIARVILVNGRPAGPEVPLREGDRLVMFPPVAGG